MPRQATLQGAVDASAGLLLALRVLTVSDADVGFLLPLRALAAQHGRE